MKTKSVHQPFLLLLSKVDQARKVCRAAVTKAKEVEEVKATRAMVEPAVAVVAAAVAEAEAMEAKAEGTVRASKAVLAPKVVVAVIRKLQRRAISAISMVMVIAISVQMVRHTTHLKKFPARASSHRREATLLAPLEVVGNDLVERLKRAQPPRSMRLSSK